MEINNNKASTRHGDADLLQRFSRGLMELTELPRCSMPERWLCEAVQGFANIVGFDAAWWGQLYLPSDTSSSIFAPSVMMDGSLGLSSSFAQEWHGISGVDRFAKASISYLGKAVRGGHDDLSDADCAEVEAFCQRHDILHSMAVTLEFPCSGMLFFVSIYRRKTSSEFDRLDAVLMEEFLNHLAYYWKQYLAKIRFDALPNGWDSYALSNRKGELLYIGKEVRVALERKYAGWQGSSLPRLIADQLSTAPNTLMSNEHKGINVHHCGDLVALTLCSQQRSSALSPRELSAARLYAQGHSHKQVARMLGITPATARTYLRSAYVQLGVSNKVALLSALRQPGE
ncbi:MULTISPECIES: helix-turn-helix domain-containing protein [unclassified Halomonas]|uniref:helix-turn-helix domain-containing protein n=1 Tax=unclassified Halomonas TaxID=2609666 RepID=UPI0006DB31A8|nr:MULTISPECIES: helix-turn-helix transcriptional regulator [unclassified Halomonas]KPQ30894.1 MAG: Response regulator containing a CheY-like receiver domain and an HTH DNA-binding domain [Halomonas sp. HL-93]SBR52798.1 transcriptional regulator, LuxR family [Halomonas sp. HL-93]SNY97820.1 transcriptional regulator, LuxR family [Halomonas sp. hl-4]